MVILALRVIAGVLANIGIMSSFPGRTASGYWGQDAWFDAVEKETGPCTK